MNVEDVPPAVLRYGATRIELIAGRAVDFPSEALFAAANARGVMASGHAGAVRLAAGAEVEHALRAQAPLLVGEAYITGAGRLSTHGVRLIVHGVINAAPGQPATRAHVERALREALARLSAESVRAVTLPDVGLRVPRATVATAAELLAETLIAQLRRGASFDSVRVVSLEGEYLRAARRVLLRGGATQDAV